MKALPILNLPNANLKLKKDEDTIRVFDFIRKKWLVLTPEEWVRQHFIHYLIADKKYPASLFALESGTNYHLRKKRTDILIYNNEGKPLLIVECKASTIKLTQEVMNQVGVYNKNIGALFICITNGLQHYCCNATTFKFFDTIPDYEDLIN